ncbi:MAG: hypothetical protein FWC25_00870 [Dehalococcoidia bacterium]|nr:hypothetical protein [Dehalococcoidia bacterium]
MFKRIALLSLCGLLLMPLFLSCQNTADTNTCTPTLDSELELKMRKDYQQYLIGLYGESEDWNNLGDISVLWYGGNYSGCEVVYMRDKRIYIVLPILPPFNYARKVEIAGYTLAFTTSQEAYAYKDSIFYTIKEAYDANLITKNDVYSIGLKIDPYFAERNPKSKFGCG